MINLVKMTVEIQPGKIEKIIDFKVWWVTPWGLVGDLQTAIQQCIANDADPNKCLKGVPAAITDGSYEITL